jgi:hypothetical protein
MQFVARGHKPSPHDLCGAMTFGSYKKTTACDYLLIGGHAGQKQTLHAINSVFRTSYCADDDAVHAARSLFEIDREMTTIADINF